MSNKNIKRRNKIYINKQKQNKQCEKCGWKEHSEILHYHHYKGEKLYEISSLNSRGSMHLIKTEIEKCILLCPNCHAWLHYQEKYISSIPFVLTKEISNIAYTWR